MLHADVPSSFDIRRMPLTPSASDLSVLPVLQGDPLDLLHVAPAHFAPIDRADLQDSRHIAAATVRRVRGRMPALHDWSQKVRRVSGRDRRAIAGRQAPPVVAD